MGTRLRREPNRACVLWAIFSVVLLADHIIPGITAVPVPLGTTCRSGCHNSNKGGKLNYLPGWKYTYDVDSAVVVSLAGSDSKPTTLNINAQAVLNGLKGDCQYSLRLQNVKVTGPDLVKKDYGDNQELVSQLDKPIQFTLSNDELHPEICTDSKETALSLNLKRAIVSLLQSAEAKSHETDIFGTCPTTISVVKNSDGTQVVTKARNLNACGHREVLTNSFIAGVVNEQSDVKSTPLLNGDYNIEQRINDKGVIESVKLTEEYSFTPFSTSTSGARARVLTKLALKNQEAGAEPKLDGIKKPNTILFENPEIIPLENLATIKEGVKNTVATYENNVGPKSASQFTELIRLLRHANKNVLSYAYNAVKPNNLARKIFLDALFRAGTADSVEAVANLFKPELKEEAHLACLSFNLASSVTKETLSLVAGLIDLNPQKECYLSIGTLVNKYCEKNAWKPNDIKPVVEKLAARLDSFLGKGRRKEDLGIATLKGLRNTGHVIGNAVNKLIEISGERQSLRVRVAAIQAFRAAENNKDIQKTALSLLKNIDEDAEIRIEAYLVLAAQADAAIAKEIQQLLDNEPSIQVGSYITSHLASLRASTDAHRQQSRAHLNNIVANKKFPRDFRQYSFNQELSYAVDTLGIGASVDTDIIYSTKSFLPRSARSNVTGALFGNDFNILELNGRQENLDSLLEHVLGPKGTLRTTDKEDWLNTLAKTTKRERRGLREDTEAIGKKVNLGNEANRDVDFDLSIKFFGTELYFLSLGNYLPLNEKDFKKRVSKWLHEQTASLKKGVSLHYENHALFLDSSLAYPTGAGLPLKFTAQGAGVVRLEASGDIDLDEFTKNPKFNIKLVPSYNIEVTGTLSVDGYAVKTGLQVSGAIHSSTGAELEFSVVDKNVELNLNLPLKKQEIFNFNHKIIYVTQERGKESVGVDLKFSSKKNEFTQNLCFDQADTFIGVTLCVKCSISGRNNSNTPLFPFNGPSHGALWLEVDKNYNFKALWDDKKEKHRSLTLIFDTPASNPSRKTTIIWEGSNEPNNPRTGLILKSPYREASAEIGYTNSDNELALYAKAVDIKDKYLAKIGFKKSGNAVRQEYEPIVTFETPKNVENDAFGYKVNGKIIVDKSKEPKVRYEFKQIEVVRDDKKSDPIGLNGFWECEGAKHDFEVTINRKQQSLTLDGEWNWNKEWNDIAAKLKLSTKEIHEQANGKLILKHKRNDKEFSYELGAGNGKNSISNKLSWKHDEQILGDWDIEFGAKANDYTLDLTSKRDIDSKTKTSTIKTKLGTSLGTNIDLETVASENPTWLNAHVSVKGTAVFDAKRDPFKLNIVADATSKLAKSDGKFEIGSVEWTSYKITIERPSDLSAPFKVDGTAKIRDILLVTAQLSSVKRAGNANVRISLPKLPREFKLDSKFNLAAPRFDVKNEIFYDADPAKKIVIDTKNEYTKASIKSDNTVECGSDKWTLSVTGSRTGESIRNGQIKGKVVLVLPSKREIVAVLDRNLNTKAIPVVGTINAKVSDTIQVDGKKTRSISFNGKLTDGNLKARLFNLVQTLELVDYDGKDLIIEGRFSHLPKGQYKSGSAGVTIKGALVTNIFDVNLGVEEYCPIHAVYRITAKYGGALNFNVKGNYHVGERGVKPSTYELNADATIPQSKLKSVKLETSGSLLRPAATDPEGQYELKLKLAGSLNEKKLVLDVDGKAINNVVTTTSSLKVDDKECNVKGAVTTTVSKPSASLEIKCGAETDIALSGSLDNTQNNAVSAKASVKVNGKECSWASNLVTSNVSPSIDVDIKCTPNQHVQFNAGVTRINLHRHKVVAKLLGLKDFNVDVSADATLHTIDNLSIILDIDAPKAKLNKAHAEVQIKPKESNERGVQVKVSNDGKNVLSGSADYTITEDKGGKTSVSGKADVKWYDETQTATFEMVRTNIDDAKNGESGSLLVFNGNLGGKKTVADIRVTNKVLGVKHTICAGSERCTNLELKSELKTFDVNTLDHDLIANFDFRKYGYEHAFNLKAITKRNGWVLDHDLEIYLETNEPEKKYTYNSYIKPKESGIKLIIPSRTVAIVTKYEVPSEILGQYEVSVAAYLDEKNQPQKHSTIGFAGKVNRDAKENAFITQWTLKFSHPNVKELKVAGKGELNAAAQTLHGSLLFDVFKTTNEAIAVDVKYGNIDKSQGGFNLTSELTVQSKGLDIDYVFSGHAGANWNRRQISAGGLISAPTQDARLSSYVSVTNELAEIQLIAFNEEMVHLKANLDIEKQKASVLASARLLGVEPIVGNAEIVGASVIANLKRGNLLKVDGEVTVGKQASLLVVGSGKELIKTKLSLSKQDFLATEYVINDADFKQFVENVRKEVKQDTDKARELITKRVDDIKNKLNNQVKNVKDNISDLSKLNNDYKEELEKLRKELLAVESIKQIVDAVEHAYTAISEISQVFVTNVKKLNQLLTEFFEQLWEGVKENVLPPLQATLKKFGQIGTSIYDELVSFALNVLDRAVKQLKTYEGDVNKISNDLKESLKTLHDALSKYVQIVQNELSEIIKSITDTIKKIPALKEIKSKLQEATNGWFVPENLATVIRELSGNLKDVLPTPELQELIVKLEAYIVDKLTSQKINDNERLQALYKSFVSAVASVGRLLRPYITQQGDGKLTSSWWAPIPLSFDFIKHIPRVPVVRVSALNYIRNEELPSVKDVLRQYRPLGFNPLNWIPPLPKVARIIEGIHLITFDGRHLTLPGACQYVLAQDVVNGNFSIVANIVDGQLKSIAVVDKNGDTVEISAEGPVKVNGDSTEYPVHQNDLHAWREYYSVHILSTYGASVHCKADLKTCSIYVNGYYHNKLRGLLGNANSEPFDDWQLPSGIVSKSLSEVAEAFKLQASCPAVKVIEHQHDKDDAEAVECSEAFGWNSPLRAGYFFIDPQSYREACAHSVAGAANKLEVACNIAFAYASVCRSENIPARVPDNCQKCRSSDASGKAIEHNVGDLYTVVNPQKKADIVLVVDTAVGDQLSELVDSTITELRKELKIRDITDAHIAVIGYNKDQKYLSQFTSKGKLDISGKFSVPKWTANPDLTNSKPVKIDGSENTNKGLETVYNAIKKLLDDLGLAPDGRAFRKALEYPFRADAGKAILAIRSDPLAYSVNPIKVLGAGLVSQFSAVRGIGVHAITPIQNLTYDNQKDVKQLVGFNGKHVLQLTDAKKRSNFGSTDLRSHVAYGKDLGVDVIQNSESGYVFSLNNYIALADKEKKQFISVAANALADQIARTEVTNECACILRHGLFAREECILKDSKQLPPIKKVARRGH